MIVMAIANVVARSRISGLDRDTALERFEGAQYRPNGYPALYIPMEKGVKISVFDSGKLVSAGANSISLATRSISLFVRAARRAGMKVSVLSRPVISLIVSHVSFPGRIIDLAGLRATPHFGKEVRVFCRIDLRFPNDGVTVGAYGDSLVVRGRDIQGMARVARYIERYTMPKAEADAG